MATMREAMVNDTARREADFAISRLQQVRATLSFRVTLPFRGKGSFKEDDHGHHAKEVGTVGHAA